MAAKRTTPVQSCNVRQPCATCPWRRDQHADTIPNFSLALAEGLASTSPDGDGMGPEAFAPQFACHQSKDGAEIVCAGWLASVGECHPMVRLAVICGDLPAEALEAKPELHETFTEVIEKLREDCADDCAESECVFCGERYGPDGFEDGLRCKKCQEEQDVEED